MPHYVWTVDEGLHTATERELREEIHRLYVRAHSLKGLRFMRERKRLLLKAARLNAYIQAGDFEEE